MLRMKLRMKLRGVHGEGQGQGGFTLVEMAMAGTMGLLTLSLGFMLYRSQAKMNIKQNDVNDAQLTVDYISNMVRTMAVSAGGGLPQAANGLRKSKQGRGMTSYYNPEDLSTAVNMAANTDTTDGIIPVTDITLFDDVGYAFVAKDDRHELAEIASVDFLGDKIKLLNPAQEAALGMPDFVYPVEYCSLYVDTAGYLRKTMVGKSKNYKKIPLATQIDSFSVTYDLSTGGNGAFTVNVPDSAKVSRVKLFVRVKGSHTLTGSTKRNFETIIGIRRGRLYNRAI